ncbi:corrinoid-binding protein [Geomonas limicola]|uniref:Corrinoid-binding protein n=1 Tax=Geomonas limicola TaxID=2740186 RepID=A0A6V8N5G3_9BACT|nr:cobalamin-dependent protein [Geomonas limicola]GFO67805.1 corrinoid-binding protein [Geomonas limicola]
MQPRSLETEELTDRLTTALLELDRNAARACFQHGALEPLAFSETVLAAALERIGDRWERGELALSQVYMSGRIAEDLLDDILPPQDLPVTSHPALAIAVLDDFHPLGKRIVSSVVRASGFRLTDYGLIGVDDLVQRARRDGIEILLISTLMYPAALRVRELRVRLDRDMPGTRLVVGGAPFRLHPNLWREVGADATSTTAAGVIPLLRRLIAEPS